jgi:NAD(P)H-dependent nitrite reductase small subunit
MAEYVPVLSVAELPPGQAAEVSVGDRTIALFNIGGTFHALTNRCPHRGGPLGQGFVDGAQVSCPLHNYTFDVRTGENVVDPALKLECYEVKVEDGRVFVKVG